MRITRIGVVTAGVLLATPAIGLATGAVNPATGTFTAKPHYSFRGHPATGTLTLIVAKHRISSVALRATLPPLDAKRSHGNACGAVNAMSSQGYKATGNVSSTGRFRYVFSRTYKQGGTVAWTDTMKLAGQFTDARHARGTFSDTNDWTAASAPGKAHCESGNVRFTASRA
jgi:hypothetical protein